MQKYLFASLLAIKENKSETCVQYNSIAEVKFASSTPLHHATLSAIGISVFNRNTLKKLDWTGKSEKRILKHF